MSVALASGLLVRAVALLYLVTFLSLQGQVLGLAGARGITPVRDVVRAAWRDYGPRAPLYFPSVLLASSSDRTLRALPTLGALSALASLVGGPWSIAALGLAWILHLSLDVAIDLLYPWDSVLFELGFLVLFLPAPSLLGWSPASEDGAPLVLWATRWLLFRVLFGFGKYKFFGPGRLHWDYLRGFMVTLPLSTPLGLWAHRALPRSFFRAGLVLLGVVELVLPWRLLWPGSAPFVAFGVVALMVAIQLTGNFGFFNLAVAMLTIAALPSLALPSLELASAHPLAFAALTTWALAGLVQLPFHSWITRAWPYWPGIARHRLPLVRGLAAFARLLSPFRLAHAYGVFSPEGGPPVKWMLAIEAFDGARWRDWPFRFLPSTRDVRGAFVAPYHPRLDHLLVYEAMGLSHHTLMGSVVGIGNPYRFSRRGLVDRLLQRLLEGSEHVEALVGPAPAGRPKSLRVRLRMLRPIEGGWTQTDLHVHASERGLEADFWRGWVPTPASFHPDECVWRRRAGGVDARTSQWAHAASAADRGAPNESFDTFVLAYGGLERLWADRPDLLRIHGVKARLRRFTMRSAAAHPPPVAPGFLRHLPSLAEAPPEADEIVPRFAWSDAGWRLEPCSQAARASLGVGGSTGTDG